MLAEALAHPVVFYSGLAVMAIAAIAFVVFLFRDMILLGLIVLSSVFVLIAFAMMMVWAECGHFISCQGG